MRYIKLSQNKRAFVDDEDYEKVAKYIWCISHVERNNYCAVARINKKVIPMHRYLLGLTDPKTLVDHINANGCDNRRKNIRICTNQQNSMNQRKQKRKTTPKTSWYKGVHWDKERQLWHCKIKLNQKNIYIGRYTTQKEAGLAYNKAAIKYFSEFANLNNIK